MAHSSTITDTRDCSVCGEPFSFVRTTGRPPEKCSDLCRTVSDRLRQRAYSRRQREAAQLHTQADAA